MLRYELDRLGWKDFEHLVKTLLKAKLGPGIEICSSLHDGGREAYFEGPLRYPDAKVEAAGPFVFQCKFVDAANAAGAQGAKLLQSAVAAEAQAIDERLKGLRAFLWREPRHYVLFTNVDLNAMAIRSIQRKLRTVMPGAAIYVHNGSDICAWIDSVPDITIRFPQLFSLGDFTRLLRDELRRESAQRSAIALGLARKIAQAFVPTKPYYEALERLRRHHLVVLEGPPEMGKTSIARMLALAHYRDGWEAIECAEPQEVVELLKEKREQKQIFLADDCFGSTDYRPERVGVWQKHLPYILHRLDEAHLLVLTCRAHLWERGKQHLSSAGQPCGFPDIAEVVVNAAELPDRDKARILYRHVKQAGLPAGIRQAVRQTAPSIVKNAHFTPERVRIFVHDLVASISASP